MKRIIAIFLMLACLMPGISLAGTKYTYSSKVSTPWMGDPTWDSLNNRLIMANFFGSLNTFASNGNAIGTIGTGILNFPSALSIDTMSNTYVGDGNLIRVFDSMSVHKGTLLTASSTVDLLDNDNEGNIWYSMGLTIKKVSPTGALLASLGGPGTDNGKFSSVGGFSTDQNGNLWVTDQPLNRVQIFDSQGNFTKSFGTPGNKPGQFNNPIGVKVFGSEVYVSDALNNRIQIFDLEGRYIRSIFISSPVDVEVSLGNLFVFDNNDYLNFFNGEDDFIPPSKPYLFAKSGNASGRISVALKVPTDAISNKLYRSTIGYATSPFSPNQILLSDNKATSLIETGLVPGKRYYYTAFSDDGRNVSTRAVSSALAAINTTTTIAKSASKVRKGRTVRISGYVRDASGKPVYRGVVDIKKWNGKTYVTVKTVYTNSKGYFYKDITLWSKTTFQNYFRGQGYRLASKSRYTVTVSVW